MREIDLQIDLIFNKKYHRQGDSFASSTGLGKKRVLSESQTRKNINLLIKYTNKFTDEELMKINSVTKTIKSIRCNE